MVAQMLLAAQIAPPSGYMLEVRAEAVGITVDNVRAAVAALAGRYPELVAKVAIQDGRVRWRRDEAVATDRVLSVVRLDPDQSPNRTFDQLAMAADQASGNALFSLVLSPARASMWLFFRVHHAIVDGSGLAALIDEFLELARAAPEDTVAQRRVSAFARTPVAEVSETCRQEWLKQIDLLPPPWSASDARRFVYDRTAAIMQTTLDRQRLDETAQTLGVTPIAVLMGCTRVTVARRFQWSLNRVTVPLTDDGDALLAIRPLPVIHARSFARTVQAEIGTSFEALLDSLDRGAPPADLVGRLTSSAVPGMPDCLLTVNDQLRMSPSPNGLVLHPGPHRGAHGLLSVELTGNVLRLSGHPAIFTREDLAGFADELTAVLEDLDDPAVSAGSRLGPVPSTTSSLVSTAESASADGDYLERCLKVWRGLFGTDVEPDDNLFALGATSFMCARVAARLRTALALPVTIRILYQHPTARELAGWATRADKP
ncbi:phosphopantetheine-binding protein [Streptomyces calidiresistens]|uniref:phosphopantetheine-binding protein n=1 Tax=Streptomyces calidiresistens TaxID=1485586 RepID=UPI002B21E343|nr:phosphopantetheine-binding protein [Streptomyces calidiresistens]